MSEEGKPKPKMTRADWRTGKHIDVLALHFVLSVSDFRHYARERREFLKLSQRAVASLMKDRFYIPWHQTVVAKIESGERQIKLNEALALSFIYGMTLDDLVKGIHIQGKDGPLVLYGEEYDGEYPEAT